MLIRSNIGTVIARLGRLDRELPKVLDAIVAPKYWQNRFEHSAERTLKAFIAREKNSRLNEFYLRLVPAIIKTFSVAAFEGGYRYSMGIPPEWMDAPGTLGAAQEFNLGLHTPTGRVKKAIAQNLVTPSAIDFQNLEQARQAILNWVMLEKRWDAERDFNKDGTPKSPEEIAERLYEILGLQEGAPAQRTGAQEAAAQELIRTIEEWLGEPTGPKEVPDAATASTAPGTGIPSGASPAAPTPPATVGLKLEPAVALEWMTAVLTAWRSIVIASLPHQIDFHLSRAIARIEQELI
jgi:hypothetical protein